MPVLFQVLDAPNHLSPKLVDFTVLSCTVGLLLIPGKLLHKLIAELQKSFGYYMKPFKLIC